MKKVLLGIVLLAIIACVFVSVTHLHHHVPKPGNLLMPTAQLDNWWWQQVGNSSGRLLTEQGVIRCEILQVDGTQWHIMLSEKAPLEEGVKYRLTFNAKSSNPRTIKINNQINHPDHHELGLEVNVPITQDWKAYDIPFTAVNVDGAPDKMPIFQLGDSVGVVWFKDIALEEAH